MIINFIDLLKELAFGFTSFFPIVFIFSLFISALMVIIPFILLTLDFL